jgi:hypothetical protein
MQQQTDSATRERTANPLIKQISDFVKQMGDKIDNGELAQLSSTEREALLEVLLHHQSE